MKTNKVCAVVILMSVLVLGLAGSSMAGKLQQELIQESAVEQIMKRGTLRVGMSTFVPWAMKDKTGKLVGFEIDVATQLAEDMGVKVEFVPTKWAGIVPALLTGKFDVIIGGMSVRPDRNLKVNFSIPYDYAGQSIVANKSWPPVSAAFKILITRMLSFQPDSDQPLPTLPINLCPVRKSAFLTMKPRSSRKLSTEKLTLLLHLRRYRHFRP